MLSSRAPNSEVCPSQRASFPSRMSLVSATARQTTNACEAPTQPSTRSTGASAMRRALSAFGTFTRFPMSFTSPDLSLEPEGNHHEPHRRVHDQRDAGEEQGDAERRDPHGRHAEQDAGQAVELVGQPEEGGKHACRPVAGRDPELALDEAVRELAGDVPAAEDDPPEEWMHPVKVDERKRARPARACTEDRLERDEGGRCADHRDRAAHGLVVTKEPAAAEAEAAIERQVREAAKEVELDDRDVDRAAEDDRNREPDRL